MDEKIADRILLFELKGRKIKKENPLRIAKACKYFVDHGMSLEEIAKRYRVTKRMIRKFLSLLSLPPSTKELVSKREIGIDVASQLAESRRLDANAKEKVGKVIANMTAHDAREVVQYAARFPNASLENLLERRQRVLASKPQVEEVSMVVVPILREETYRRLKEESDKQKISIHELVERIIEEWLKAKG